MKILKLLSSAVFCAAGLAALGANANAAVIPVVNSTFGLFPAGQTAKTYLTFGCGTGCAFSDSDTFGWTQSVNTYTRGADAGQWQTGVPQTTNNFNSDPMINATTPEPIVVRAINATISQVVSTTAVAGETYTLNVDLGFEKTNLDDGSVYLVVDGHKVLANPLASYKLTQTQMQESGNWYDFEASYTATSADAHAPIEILLSSLTNGKGFAFFGDVQLTDSWGGPVLDPPAAPEPATWAMMLIGFGGMAGGAVRRSYRQRSASAGQLA
jgi:hypothetical protein